MSDPRRGWRDDLSWWLENTPVARLLGWILYLFVAVLSEAGWPTVLTTLSVSAFVLGIVVAVALLFGPSPREESRPREPAVALRAVSEPSPVRLVAKTIDSVICPFCKDAVDPAVSHVECEKCKTRHHPSCFRDNGKCAVHGCGEKLPRIVRVEKSA